jgi:SAM-dependent methyltransferase
MTWKARALLLRLMATLPGGMAVYQLLQHWFGLHRHDGFMEEKFRRHRDLAGLTLKHGGRLHGAHIVEVGTGWVPLVPLAWWLTGAEAVHTFDLNRHLLPDLLGRALQWMRGRRDWLLDLYRDLPDDAVRRDRLDRLLAVTDANGSHFAQPEQVLRMAGIHYLAPANAARTGLPAHSIDLHYSTNVMEHVPGMVIAAILKEARRVLRPDGLAIHHVDPSDHFAHHDATITRINFLQFTQPDWDRYAGNRLAYHNRLRDPDFRQLLRDSGLDLIDHQFQVDERGLKALHQGFPLAQAYRKIPFEVLCRERLQYVARPPVKDNRANPR